ncbi:MAG: tRNA lysidine(34) synthetase TilS [Nitrospinae bacterium]|nr:tRNA lysidine(34) synthetase TilS [Nitrospinota bacterium]
MIQSAVLTAAKQLIKPGETVCAAVSGGPDSTALLLLLHELRTRLGISIAALHINHGLRGAESDEDARFCRELCARLGVPYYEQRIHLERYMDAAGGSVQSAARDLRYLIFRRTVERGRANVIATAHTADDVAETFLLNLLRGAGPRGLSGLPKTRGAHVVRPLTGVHKADLLAWLDGIGQPYRTDSSNFANKYARNRVRNQLIPYLERDYNPAVRAALLKTATIFHDAQEFLAATAKETAAAIGTRLPEGGLSFPCARFAPLPVALQREVIRRALGSARKHLMGVTFDHLEGLRHLAAGNMPHGEISLKGIRAYAAHGVFYCIRAPLAIPPFAYPLPPSGYIPIAETGAAVGVETTDRPPHSYDPACATVYIDAAMLPPGAEIRNRRAGDVFAPLGAPGTRKLKKFFIDAKIPRWERDGIPLLAAGNEVLWIAGVRLSERVKITPGTKRILKLQLRPGAATAPR